MGKRRELRLYLLLTVKVWGTDASGKRFEQHAKTIDLTATGVRLGEVHHSVEPGTILHLQHRDSMARFRVRWIGKDKSAGQIGLELLKGEKFDWGRRIPSIPGDAFTDERIDKHVDFKYLR